jgi:hypothetical protein
MNLREFKNRARIPNKLALNGKSNIVIQTVPLLSIRFEILRPRFTISSLEYQILVDGEN